VAKFFLYIIFLDKGTNRPETNRPGTNSPQTSFSTSENIIHILSPLKHSGRVNSISCHGCLIKSPEFLSKKGANEVLKRKTSLDVLKFSLYF